MGEVGEAPNMTADVAPSRWSYKSHFREYLLLLARKGDLGLESIQKFPEKIELNNPWHETFEDMRKQTEDGHERWALIGYKEDMRVLIVPTIFAYGENSNQSNGYKARVTYDVMEKQINRAKDKAHLIGLVGDVHTHPENTNAWRSSRLSSDNNKGFSAADLYWLASKRVPFYSPFKVLVEGKNVYFAFVSKETRKSTLPLSQEQFGDYWHNLEEDGKKKHPDILSMNIDIAKTHSIALYKGKIGGDLGRIYP